MVKRKIVTADGGSLISYPLQWFDTKEDKKTEIKEMEKEENNIQIKRNLCNCLR